jgi:hypothetical protein
MADAKVKNAVINALLDEMEEAQGVNGGGGDDGGAGLIRETE